MISILLVASVLVCLGTLAVALAKCFDGQDEELRRRNAKIAKDRQLLDSMIKQTEEIHGQLKKIKGIMFTD